MDFCIYYCFFVVCYHFVSYVYTLGGDLVALEIVYHFSCLTEYRSHYRSNLHKKNSTSNTHIEKIKALAFVELIENTEEIYIFKLKEMPKLYKDHFNELGYGIDEVNSILTMLLLPSRSERNGWCILTLNTCLHV